MKTIKQIANENKINKVCIDGMIMDIRQLDQNPFKVIPLKYEIMENTIFNEGILFCWSN